ncbi:MAG: hypothetical protein FJ308_00305 [Planctomycetes bacterium]|nr:hypothetical protein [Planctomycetota bacterium]
MVSRVLAKMMAGIRGFWRVSVRAGCLVLLLSVVATIPILQFASLGYMLESASRISRGLPLRSCFPGSETARRIVLVGFFLAISWLPVWLVTDWGYSAELMDPGSVFALRIRIGARLLAVLWIVWSGWAIFRGGRWYHFLWPAPKRFVTTIFQPDAWRQLEDRLWNLVVSLRVAYLMKMGFYASIGALIWLLIPAALIIVALNGGADRPSDGSNPEGVLGLIGLVGAISMWWVLQKLPFLQIHMVNEGKLRSILDRTAIRNAFRRAPWAFSTAIVVLVLLSIPLYPLRIELIPSQLRWALALFFVLLMFPTKLLAGWALRRSNNRTKPVHWFWRWIAWIPMVGSIAIYVGVLYLAKFALWEGAASILLQHAFLPPVPFYLR